jgi:hypothetical protein
LTRNPVRRSKAAMSEALIDVLKWQGAACAAMGSPFSGALLERAAAALTDQPAFQAIFTPWRDLGRRQLFDDAVALRWLGALHDLALEQPRGALAAAYAARDADQAWPLILGLMDSEAGPVAAFMRHEPQTNEVRRSAVLLPGFLAIAAATGLPLRILELGASAGLNQLWDQRQYRLGEIGEWGPTDARVSLDIDWRGPAPPLEAPVRVAARAACDRKPVDLADPVQRRRLKAYVWPDQDERLKRLEAAIAETLAAGVTVEAADAVAWTRREAHAAPGVATVVFHSVFFGYMPPASQSALVSTLAEAGERASRDAPLAWLRMEPASDNPAIMELRLTLWPGGEDRRLATAHPHGAWIEWAGG